MAGTPDKRPRTWFTERLRSTVNVERLRPGLPLLPPPAAFAELAVFVLVILLLDWQLPRFDLNTIQPNPCWLPVLLLSLQYGTVSGLLAAAVAIVLTVIGGFPDQELDEPYFAYLLRIWGQPLLWIGAAVLLGQFRYRQITEKFELRRRVEELESQRAAIAANAANLRLRCDALERHIAARREPALIRVLAGLAEGSTRSSEEARAAFSPLMQLALPGCSAVLYRRDGSAWRRVAVSGTVTPSAAPELISGSTPLTRAIDGGHRAFSVMTPEGERLLAGTGVAAAAVLEETSGEPIGFVRIDALDPALLGPELPAALQAIARSLRSAVLPVDQHDRAAPIPAAAAAPESGLTAGLRRGWWQLRSLTGGAEPEKTAVESEKTTFVS